MTTADLKITFAISQNQLELFLQDITAEQAAERPHDINPINWILGHILTERLEAIMLMGVKFPEGRPRKRKRSRGNK